MDRDAAAALMIDIAREDVGKREVTTNRAPWIEKLWPLTNAAWCYDPKVKPYYGRAPYCAAGMAYVLATFIEKLAAAGELRKTLGMSLAQANAWRCKSAAAFGWRDWAAKKNVRLFPDSSIPMPGDFVVFDFSHIGLVVKPVRSEMVTIEYNTNSGGSRDGDGCWEKMRRIKEAQCFVRIMP